MISVSEAHAAIFERLAPVGAQSVSVGEASGRVLRREVVAALTQPPAAMSAMDGYAARRADAAPGARLKIVGSVAAGDPPGARLQPGETMRVFTGAAVPDGADVVVIQETVLAEPDGWALLLEGAGDERYIRPRGGDFAAGDALLSAPRRLRPEDIALAAAAGAPWLDVARRPRVALLALGDELRRPGEPLGPGQITASSTLGVAAIVAAAGAEAEIAPITPDDRAATEAAIAAAAAADVIVTLGGASDGAHDLARPAFAALGAAPSFYKIAMRPGKPLHVGQLGRALTLGLPGNPVSAMVCARLFLAPALEGLLGFAPSAPARRQGVLGDDMPDTNGPREHYMRAALSVGPGGAATLRPFARQDSSLLSVLAGADALAVRPPHDPPRRAGDPIDFLPL